mmetsp:Transcript_4935/g.14213  ORF Transcript_4935/g.14213 Transcript_4935/m.14213 type:complete len:211 (-) Transcript_4935:196-828(-)
MSAAEATTSKPSNSASDGKAESKGEPTTHPLEHKWTLWFDNPKGSQRPQTWGDTLKPVYTFDSVEDFWRLYNNIKPPSWLGAGTDFHLFKKGIQPKWEDPQCEAGGKWTILVPRGGGNSKQFLDKFWLHSLLACIGEQFSHSDEICGVVVNMRQKQDKVCLWTKTASNEAVQIGIGKQFKEFLEFDQNCGYLVHNDAKILDRKAKDRYTI